MMTRVEAEEADGARGVDEERKRGCDLFFLIQSKEEKQRELSDE